MQNIAGYSRQRVSVVVILLGGVGAAVLFLGSCWSGHGEKWNHIADLPSGSSVRAVAVSDDGVGAIGGYFENGSAAGTAEEQVADEVAAIWRVEGKRVEKVYQSRGWIQALNGSGPNWCAVASALKPTGSGSRYRLLRSPDQARTWQDAGNIPAKSIVQVLVASASTIYVFGAADTLLATTDGGQNWNPLPMPAAATSREFTAAIALGQDGSLLAFGSGLMRLSPGTKTWDYVLPGQYTVEAVSDPYVAAVIDQKLQLLRRTAQSAAEIGELPYDREPERIAYGGDTIRIFTTPRDPASQGFFGGGMNRVLLRSDDGGKSWTSQGLGSIQKADLRGTHLGLGADALSQGVFSCP
jgi:hypothetical protein